MVIIEVSLLSTFQITRRVLTGLEYSKLFMPEQEPYHFVVLQARKKTAMSGAIRFDSIMAISVPFQGH